MAQHDVRKFDIGANTFGIRPMNPFEALAILGDLQKVILPVIGNMAAGLDNLVDNGKAKEEMSVGSLADILEKNIDISKLGVALANASANLDGDTLAKLAQKLLKENLIAVQFEGGSQSKLSADTIAELFAGNLSEMMELIVKVIEVNYGDFFTFLGKIFGKVNAAKQLKKPDLLK